MTNPHRSAAALAAKCSDAYSYDRYTDTGWWSCVRFLQRKGYDDREIEAVLRSKYMRWASDDTGKAYGNANSKDLERFIERCASLFTPKAIADLVADTF